MALSIGELVGYIDLDAGPAHKAMGAFEKLLGGSSSRWGKILGGAGALAGGAFATSLVGAMNLEPSRDRVAASLALNEQQAARAGRVSGQLYADGWGASAEDVDLALEAVMSSIKGMRTASESQLSAATEAALTFSQAMGIDVTRAAQVAGNMVANGLAKDATEAFDLLTQASSRVPKQLREDVLDAADEYGQFFNQLGIEGPQAMSMLAAGAEKGMYGIDKAGDAVKEFTIRATDMSTASKDAYQTIGLDAEKMAQKILKGGPAAREATNQIVSSLLDVQDPAKRANAAIALFGTPLEDLSTKEIPAFLRSLQSGKNELGKWQGATKRAGDTMQDNASTNLTAFTRKLKQGFVNVLGGQVLPTVTEWSGTLNTAVGPALSAVGSALSAVTGFMAEHETATKLLATAIAAFLLPNLILMGTTAMVNGAKAVAAWTMQQVAAARSLAVHTMTALRYVALFALMGAQALIHAARMAAAWVIAMGPVGWVIAAVVGLVALVIANWDKVKRWTLKAWNAIVGAVKKAWQWIKAAVTAGAKLVATIVSKYVAMWRKVITTAWNAILKAARVVWNAIVAVVRTYIRMALSVIRGLASIPGKVRDWFGRAKDAAASALGRLVDVAREIPGRILSALSNIGSRMWSIGKDIVRGIWSGISGMGGWIVDKLSGWASSVIPGPIKKALGIGSPSKVLAEQVGRWLPAGVVQGALANGGVLDKAGDDMASRLLGATRRGMSSRMPQLGRAASSPREVYRERVVERERGPLIGKVEQRDDEDTTELAERLWFVTRSRG